MEGTRHSENTSPKVVAPEVALVTRVVSMDLLVAGQFITMSEDLQPTVSVAESVRSVAREAVEVHTHKAGLVRMRSVGTVGLVFRTVSLVQ
jgi:hypothetical protein